MSDTDREKADAAAILTRQIQERDEQIRGGLEHADPGPLADAFISLIWSRGWRPTGAGLMPTRASAPPGGNVPEGGVRTQLEEARRIAAESAAEFRQRDRAWGAAS